MEREPWSNGALPLVAAATAPRPVSFRCCLAGARAWRLRSLVGLTAAAALCLLRPAEPRGFSLFSDADAQRLLAGGFVDTATVGRPGAGLAEELSQAVNSAVSSIRAALLAAGTAGTRAPAVAPRRAAGEAAQWWIPNDAHPEVWKLAVTGGVCSGKTSSASAVRQALETSSNGTLLVLAVPEVASVLYGCGAMSHGSFSNYVAAEYREYMVQSEVLQLAFEELWARAAEEMLQGRPKARHAVLLTDRDALDGKAYSRPLDPSSSAAWRDVLAELGRRLGAPGLTDRALAGHYELGAVVLQSRAVLDGHLNAADYEACCLGAAASGSTRRESAAEAEANDERVALAYEEAYPREKLCRVTNERIDFAAKVQSVVDFAWQQINQRSSAPARG